MIYSQKLNIVIVNCCLCENKWFKFPPFRSFTAWLPPQHGSNLGTQYHTTLVKYHLIFFSSIFNFSSAPVPPGHHRHTGTTRPAGGAVLCAAVPGCPAPRPLPPRAPPNPRQAQEKHLPEGEFIIVNFLMIYFFLEISIY